jgi:osmotically-inducible protein OsmY
MPQRERGWWDRTTDEVSSWFGDEDAARRREQDHFREGSHRGKGPKGYQRSDDRIKDDINDRLSDDPFVDASEVDVSVQNGEVTLTGTVRSRSDKRRAEDLADAVSGVRNVEVRLRVQEDRYNTGEAKSSYVSNSAVTGTASVDKNKMKQSSLTESK